MQVSREISPSQLAKCTEIGQGNKSSVRVKFFTVVRKVALHITFNMPTTFDKDHMYLGNNQPVQTRGPVPRPNLKFVSRSVTPVHHSAEAEEEAHGCRNGAKISKCADIEN